MCYHVFQVSYEDQNINAIPAGEHVNNRTLEKVENVLKSIPGGEEVIEKFCMVFLNLKNTVAIPAKFK